MTVEAVALRPLIEAAAAATIEVTAPGSPFEIIQEVVGGETMSVYRHRPRSLSEVLRSAAAYGARECYIFDDGSRISFDQLEPEVASVVAALSAQGIRRGDRVAICAANSPGWLLSFWAVTSMGAVVVAMNGWWTGVEMHHALTLTEPALLLGDTKRLARLGPCEVPVVSLDDGFAALRHHQPGDQLRDTDTDTDTDTNTDTDTDTDTDIHTESDRDRDPAIDEDDPAMLLFTSGTTGRPKAAVLTHRNIVAFVMTQSFLAARGLSMARRAPAPQPATRLAVYPLFHVSGLGTAVSGMLTGTTTVWVLGRFEAARVIEITKQYGIRSWSGTVTHIMRLLDEPSLADLDPMSIQQVGVGGSASSPELIRRTEERFPHLRGTFSSGYGSSETGGLISHASNAMLAIAPDCVGPPLPTVEVRIVDDEGGDLPEGQEGNICVRSPLVMKEYWNHSDANAEAFLPHRWLKTGDFGRLEAGALFLASRRRDLIIRGGENVYPFEIENRIEEHPDVIETAVIGVDHPVLGQEIKAVVVPRPGAVLSEAAIGGWCAETLSSYKVPAYVELRTEALPRNASGKIMKHLLTGETENMFVEE